MYKCTLCPVHRVQYVDSQADVCISKDMNIERLIKVQLAFVFQICQNQQRKNGTFVKQMLKLKCFVTKNFTNVKQMLKSFWQTQKCSVFFIYSTRPSFYKL